MPSPLPSLLRERGAPLAEALACFDALPPVEPELLWGRWRGRELRTGHPMEGWLEACGWYGKEFLDPENVHPLLFRQGEGRPFPVRALPGALATARRLPHLRLPRAESLLRLGMGLLRTRHSQARLRRMEVRGTVTATMLYDHLPVHDAFRRVDDDTVLGLMDEKGGPGPISSCWSATERTAAGHPQPGSSSARWSTSISSA